ncbi:MAG: hypothetical protein WBI27_15020, partial [Thermoanaerobaculia bacterium]
MSEQPPPLSSGRLGWWLALLLLTVAVWLFVDRGRLETLVREAELGATADQVRSTSADELQGEITARTERIGELEQELEKIEGELRQAEEG